MALVNSTVPAPGLPMSGTRQGRSTARPQSAEASETVAPAQQLLSASQTFKDVETWLSNFEKRPNLRTLKAKELKDSISSFYTFSKQYIEKLTPLAESTSLSWLGSTMDNVLLDYWEPILRAVEQNRSAHYRTLLQRGYERLDALQKDLQARLHVKKFDVNIVLYFDRVGKARRYPFGNTYLIGIPLIDAYREDWMALPHELGHHLFWKARFSEFDSTPEAPQGTNFLQVEIDDAMRQLKLSQDAPARAMIQKLLDDWTEEIFADVVGARLAGREFVDSTWDWLSRRIERKRELFETDGEHPFLYLLPALRAAAAEVELEDQWKKRFGDIQYTDLAANPSVDKKLQDPSIKIEDLSTAIQLFARNITARLRGIQIDRLIEDGSSITELKRFEAVLSTGAGKAIQSSEDETARLRALLKPFILERNLAWTCRGPVAHVNPGTARFCEQCGIAKNILSYIPIPSND